MTDEAGKPKAESIGRGSKRSLRLGRDRSKRGDEPNEKVPRPNPEDQPRQKKKGGLLSLLCCTSGDHPTDASTQDPAQPAKPATKPQPTRAQQPPTQQQRPQNNSQTDTSATQDSKDVMDEKAAQKQAATDGSKSEPMPSASENEKMSAGDASGRQGSNPDAQRETNLPPPIVTSGPSNPAAGDNLNAPAVNVQAPTPTAPTVDESAISDRSPDQQKMDEEMEIDGQVPMDEEKAREIREEIEHQQHEEQSTAQTTEAAAASAPLPGPPAGTPPISDASTPDPRGQWLLPPIRPEFKGRKCLVLDLDETLVHSSFKVRIRVCLSKYKAADSWQILHQADFTIPVEIEGQYHNVYVIKRPGVDAFLKRVGELYEVVVFTASVSKYGDPLLDQLDIHNVVHHRLFRESCYNHQGNYVKDLSQVGRALKDTIIIDNSPTSYIFHPQHAVPISSWFSDAHDNELCDLIPVLEDLAGSKVQDVSMVLDVAL